MKLIVGLGNPGKEYEKTRHNAGFIAIADFRSQIADCEEFSFEGKFNAEIAQGIFDGEKIILAKPMTFMNNSGEAVKKIADFYKIAPEDITVIHDDLDIPFGEVRVKNDGSSAGHNGVQSIIDNLGTEVFRRVRIGIGRPMGDIPADKYVLQSFSEEEQAKLPEILEKIGKIISN
ncbi:aminoacyl-tRNA hydrolase [Candidatus Microgenomates bacterium]|nr:aminoacyl-tRNA hydrolase [Candidatus Microgenomates bacterium]